ncbi:MAG: helix-turn-helix domain-containing protein [Mycobacterium sp.]|uniref:helix-turn-helix domain-containing protein n=1 Tax=Mycobacterium sp. TaxID=1785 RepID=UPI003C3324D7
MEAAATLDPVERPTSRAAVGQPLSREQWILSLPQAQAALGGIGLTMVYKLIDSGSIQRVKIGRRAFITQASIDAFIASLTAA